MAFMTPRRSRSDLQRKNDIIRELERICSSPLPEGVADCAREMQLLAHCQLIVGKRFQELGYELANISGRIERSESIFLKKEQSQSLDVPKKDINSTQYKPLVDLRKVETEEEVILSYESNLSKLDDFNISRRFCGTFAKQDLGAEDNEQSAPLVIALKKLQKQHQQRKTIKTWIYSLASLFRAADFDRSGSIDSEEYIKMVNYLDINEGLKSSLIFKFDDIDSNGNGSINLSEFLNFFLVFPNFNTEIVRHANTNAPFLYESSLSRIQKWRLWLYNIVEVPASSMLSKTIFCIDLVLAIIPAAAVLVQSILPGYYVNWSENLYLWPVSIFFASQYLCGLLTCKSSLRYINNTWHIVDLISFAFWIVCNSIMKSRSLETSGFVIFRTLRIFKLSAVFNLQTIREELTVYNDTIQLAWTSYGTIAGIMIYLIFFLSLLIHVFERGTYDWDSKTWIRDEEDAESPFANLYNCIYFTLVTMTTVGYGDYSPNSYVGKLLALIAALCGIYNVTLLINIYGQCFEEVFREFTLRRSKQIEEKRLRYIHKHVTRASKTVDQSQENANISFFSAMASETSL